MRCEVTEEAHDAYVARYRNEMEQIVPPEHSPQPSQEPEQEVFTLSPWPWTSTGRTPRRVYRSHYVFEDAGSEA